MASRSPFAKAEARIASENRREHAKAQAFVRNQLNPLVDQILREDPDKQRAMIAALRKSLVPENIGLLLEQLVDRVVNKASKHAAQAIASFGDAAMPTIVNTMQKLKETTAQKRLAAAFDLLVPNLSESQRVQLMTEMLILLRTKPNPITRQAFSEAIAAMR